MALATGSQHMNLLAPASGAALAADGAAATAAVTLQSGSTASTLMLAASDAAQFKAGSMIAVDVDYTGQTGFVGSPVAGAYVRQPLDRRRLRSARHVQCRVGRAGQRHRTHAGRTTAGRTPAAGAKLQAISGFVDREGGSFYQEWSALFVMQGSQGERIFFHYPRLQSMAGAEEQPIPLDNKQKGGPQRMLLKGRFLALPVTDSLDGERILCYRAFLPAPNALI